MAKAKQTVKTEVTEENMGEIFNQNIYPLLSINNTPEKLGKTVKNILKEYSFETELMKVRFMIPVIDAVTKSVMDSIGLEFNEMDQGVKQQVGWNFVQTWMMNGVFTPVKMINYGDLLNASASEAFTDLYTLDDETKGWLQKEASFIVENADKGEFDVTPVQKEHLTKIKDGNLPFGFK